MRLSIPFYSGGETLGSQGRQPVSATVDTVILAGEVGADATWTGGIPRPLLPLPGHNSLLESLLSKIGAALGGSCSVCVNKRTGPISNRALSASTSFASVQVIDDPLPRGSAGCLQACKTHCQSKTLFVAGASTWLDDDPNWMVAQHEAQGNALTVFCVDPTPEQNGRYSRDLRPLSFYCMDRSVLDFIPATGFRDIKEQIVPALQKAGLRVGAVVLKGETREILNWGQYLNVLAHVLEGPALTGEKCRQLAPGIWCGESVSIEPNARIVGPAYIGSGSVLKSGALIVGPTVLGAGSHIGRNARLWRVVAPFGAKVEANTTIADRVLSATKQGATPTPGVGVVHPKRKRTAQIDSGTFAEGEGLTLGPPQSTGLRRLRIPGAIACLFSLFLWSFWSSVAELWHVWQHNADYGAGQLVPLAFAYMVFAQRRSLDSLRFRFYWPGLALFGFGVALDMLGTYYLYSFLRYLGLVVCANGLILTAIGRQGFKRLLYPLLFLFLMIPLPGRVHDAVMLPLQTASASLSAGALEMIGHPVAQFGHILEIGGQQMAVAEACNGLRMALAFLIVAVVFAFFARRPNWQKALIIISSIPIAIFCNILRIVITASLFEAGHEWLARGAMHDIAGLLMMPVALGIIFLELALLANVQASIQDSKRARSISDTYGTVA